MNPILCARQFCFANVEITVGDIVQQGKTVSIVHPTDSRFSLNGLIGRKIRENSNLVELKDACSKLAPLQTGEVAITKSFGLAASSIIHCKAPKKGDRGEQDLLRLTYANVLELADKSGEDTVAIPALSTGSGGLSIATSAAMAIEAIKDMGPSFSKLRKVRFVLPNADSADVFSKELMKQPSLPEGWERFNLLNKYSKMDFEAMRCGVFGDWDSKWFAYYEEPWLLIYRGNRRYGECFYAFRLPQVNQQSDSLLEMEEAWCSASFSEIRVTHAQDVLDLIFGLVSLVDDKDVHYLSGAKLWKKYQKIVIALENEMISALEARRLASELLAMADELERGS